MDENEFKLAKKAAATAKRKMPIVQDFTLVKAISRGAFGKVFLGHRKDNPDQLYAIKAIKKSDIVHKNMVHQMIRERDTLAHIQSPFCVQLYYSLQDAINVYLVMEYLVGGDLKSLVTYGYLDQELAIFYIAELALALDYLHRRGIVHRDVKPDNLLLDNKGHLKLTDFGLSKILDAREQQLERIAISTPNVVGRAALRYARTPGQALSLTSHLSFFSEDDTSTARAANDGSGAATSKAVPRPEPSADCADANQTPLNTSKDRSDLGNLKRHFQFDSAASLSLPAADKLSDFVVNQTNPVVDLGQSPVASSTYLPSRTEKVASSQQNQMIIGEKLEFLQSIDNSNIHDSFKSSEKEQFMDVETGNEDQINCFNPNDEGADDTSNVCSCKKRQITRCIQSCNLCVPASSALETTNSLEAFNKKQVTSPTNEMVISKSTASDNDYNDIMSNKENISNHSEMLWIAMADACSTAAADYVENKTKDEDYMESSPARFCAAPSLKPIHPRLRALSKLTDHMSPVGKQPTDFHSSTSSNVSNSTNIATSSPIPQTNFLRRFTVPRGVLSDASSPMVLSSTLAKDAKDFNALAEAKKSTCASGLTFSSMEVASEPGKLSAHTSDEPMDSVVECNSFYTAPDVAGLTETAVSTHSRGMKRQMMHENTQESDLLSPPSKKSNLSSSINDCSCDKSSNTDSKYSSDEVNPSTSSQQTECGLTRAFSKVEILNKTDNFHVGTEMNLFTALFNKNISSSAAAVCGEVKDVEPVVDRSAEVGTEAVVTPLTRGPRLPRVRSGLRNALVRSSSFSNSIKINENQTSVQSASDVSSSSSTTNEDLTSNVAALSKASSNDAASLNTPVQTIKSSTVPEEKVVRWYSESDVLLHPAEGSSSAAATSSLATSHCTVNTTAKSTATAASAFHSFHTPQRTSSLYSSSQCTPRAFINGPTPRRPPKSVKRDRPLSHSAQVAEEDENRILGTPDYLAPEILLRIGHGPPVDWWAMGVCLFEFLTGLPPFNDVTADGVFKNILNRDIPWPVGQESLSSEAIQAIDQLLTFEPELRPTLETVKKMSLFRSVEWDTIHENEAPFVPQVESATDTFYFSARNKAQDLKVSSMDLQCDL